LSVPAGRLQEAVGRARSTKGDRDPETLTAVSMQSEGGAVNAETFSAVIDCHP
jgi:hypothetical protein